ncbi:protein kinase [Streptomyces sp. NPDC093085]|uniref:protein kinase domain-containing protein n=1 Tax=Streptomyces sp. NPDC093085 TaxID=3155068 RepID=UPI0034214BBE
MLNTPEAGHRIADRYVLQEAVGRGGMGIVWLAWDERLRRPVAVKCARPGDGEAVARLRTEGRYAARLHHPNIVPVFDLVEEDTACWIVMEYVPAPSLARMVADEGPLPPEAVGSIGRQIAAALAKSHAEGVVHGDVTPENILVTAEGVARLTDFGIARALWSDVTQTHTTTGAVRGKVKYLAPEVAKGRAADEKADVFSLGASLFAAVEGHSPYGEAEHPVAYLARAAEARIETAERAGPLAGALAVLLAADPRQRADAVEAHGLLTGAAPAPVEIPGGPGEDRSREAAGVREAAGAGEAAGGRKGGVGSGAASGPGNDGPDGLDRPEGPDGPTGSDRSVGPDGLVRSEGPVRWDRPHGSDGPDRLVRSEGPVRSDRPDGPDGPAPVRPPFRYRRTLAAVVAGAVVAGALALGVEWGRGEGGGSGTGTAASDSSASSAAVPAGAAGGIRSDGAGGEPGTIGEARTADPCALLDATGFNRYGENKLDPDYGEFDRCDLLVHNGSGHDVADLEVNFNPDAPRFDGDIPTRRMGGLTVGVAARDGRVCERFVATADHKEILVRGKELGTPSPDPCALADTGVAQVTAVLAKGAVPRRAGTVPKASLARLDACDLLDEAAIRKVPRIGAGIADEADHPDHGFGAWYCDWESRGDDAGVEIQFSRDNDLTDDGKHVSVAGKDGYLSPREYGDDTCLIRVAHRTYVNYLGDTTVEHSILTVHGPGSPDALCAAATTLAATVTRKIGEQLPEAK